MMDQELCNKESTMQSDIASYNAAQTFAHFSLCKLLAGEIGRRFPHAESKIWHGHPVWFLNKNPIVGYSKQKHGIRLMFWSGADFDEEALNIVGKKFKDASVFFNDCAEVDYVALSRWLSKAQEIQWDYANIIKRKGRLERLTGLLL
jgi:uncharacterized protein YdhG (YjbR/CyaY superfamily)